MSNPKQIIPVKPSYPYGAVVSLIQDNRKGKNGNKLVSWDLYCEKKLTDFTDVWFTVDKFLTTLRSFRNKLLFHNLDGEIHASGVIGQTGYESVIDLIEKFRITEFDLNDIDLVEGQFLTASEAAYISGDVDTFFTQDVNAFHLIFIQMEYSTVGGYDDIHNDCLWTAIRKSTNYRNFKKITNPAAFKKALNLGRDQLVPLSLMPKIEDLLHINIDVHGNPGYASRLRWKTKPVIRIRLENDHYELLNSYNGNYLNKFVLNKERKVVFYARSGSKIILETGEELTSLEFDKYFKHMVVEASQLTLIEMYAPILKHRRDIARDSHELCGNDDSDFQYYRKIYEEVRAALKKPTKSYNHWFEMDRTSSMLQVSLTIFRGLSYEQLQNHDIETRSKLEDEWLSRCYYGGIVYAKPGKFENAHQWDFNSMYPWVMSKQIMPVGQPVLVKEKSPFQSILGIYDITIASLSSLREEKCEKADDQEKVQRCPTFQTSKKIKNRAYTTHDLRTLDNMGIKYIVNEGIEYKAVRIFDDFVNYMDELRESVSSPGAKIYVKFLRNMLWGYLSKKNKKKSFVSTNANARVVSFESDEQIYKVKATADPEIIKMISRKTDEYVFANSMAKCGAFITSYARHVMNRITTPFEHQLVRVHTDSVLLADSSPAAFEAHLLSLNSKEIPQYLRINTGVDQKKIGFMKHEKEGTVEITASNRALKWTPR